MKVIKGVTKNVIEINMNSEYFEKAIVILKEDCPIEDDDLKREARLAIGDAPVFLKTLKTQIRIKMAVCAVSGALAATLIFGTVLWAVG